MAIVLNVSFDQGANSQFNINVANNGVSVDLTGYSANAHFKKHANAYANTVQVMTTTGYANGLLNISMTASETSNVNWGRYYYTVEITQNSSNTTTRIQEGILTIRP